MMKDCDDEPNPSEINFEKMPSKKKEYRDWLLNGVNE